MRLEYSNRFSKRLRTLSKDNKNVIPQVEKTLLQLQQSPPAHPALRMKRIQGADGVFECSVNMEIRITFQFTDSNTIFLRNIDHHDRSLKHE